MNWETYNLPFAAPPVTGHKAAATAATHDKGIFFKGDFTLDRTADTYFDLSQYRKGIVWINGHNLGRYWSVGPQQRLYCPASWLRKGNNVIVLFDLLQANAASVKGVTTPE
jgi:beta-galactosidase